MAEVNVNEMIDGYVKNARKALEEFMSFDQEKIDAIVKAMTLAGLDKHMELAKMAVEEPVVVTIDDTWKNEYLSAFATVW